MDLAKTNVEGLIGSVTQDEVDRYSQYWRTIRPITLEERFRRWLFSYCSVRATWKMNKNTYALLSTEPWQTKEELRALLERARIGMYEVRTEGIWQLGNIARYNPILLMGHLGDWQEWRDHLVSQLFGLGMAKVSFALEMCHPIDCRVVCFDTHILRMYGTSSDKLTPKLYHEMEDHWLAVCDQHKYPSPMVRHILWDRIQKKPDTRYWSYVLET